MTLILFLFFLVLSLSFLCSLLESVILSVTPAYATIAIKEKKRFGPILNNLVKNLDRPLAAILAMNTVVNTLGSTAIAYQIQQQYDEKFLTLFSIALTLSILFISEILPKSIGSKHWKLLAPFVTYASQLLIFLLYPFVFVSKAVSAHFSGTTSTPEVSREEMIAAAEMGVHEGTFKSRESLMIKNLLMLNQIYVSDIMTPRSVIFALDSNEDVEHVEKKHRPIRFSRLPVYQENLDNIIGMTHRYKILEALSHDQHDKKVGDLSSSITRISESLSVSQAIDFFIREKEHMALAVDEYGITTGLVTLEDAIETLLGVEIVDEFDSVTDMRKYALEQWQIRKQKLRKS